MNTSFIIYNLITTTQILFSVFFFIICQFSVLPTTDHLAPKLPRYTIVQYLEVCTSVSNPGEDWVLMPIHLFPNNKDRQIWQQKDFTWLK